MSYNNKLDRLRLIRTSIQRDMNGLNVVFSSPDKQGQERAKQEMNRKRQEELDRIDKQIYELEMKAREEQFQSMLDRMKIDIDTSGLKKSLDSAIEKAFQR